MIIASNLKAGVGLKTTSEYINKLSKWIKLNKNSHEIIVFPNQAALFCLEKQAGFKGGAQNFYPAIDGSFTGEVTKKQLEELGLKTVLIGHSERRHLLNESSSLILQKVEFAIEHGFEIVYCIGEPLSIRESSYEAVLEYLWSQLDGIDINYESLVIAYEPVWAIGTGKSASIEVIENTLKSLKAYISVPLLYGGSVSLENIESIISLDYCDGVLVGTSSWDCDNFCKMIEIVNTVKKERC